MDERVEAFLADVLALEGEDANATRQGVRVALADYEQVFRAREVNRQMGFRPHRANAATLARKEHISVRVAELQEEQLAIHQQATAAAAANKQVTIESLIAEAEAARAKAMSEKGGAAAAVRPARASSARLPKGAARLWVSGMAITGTVPEPRRLSSFGASSNRCADVRMGPSTAASVAAKASARPQLENSEDPKRHGLMHKPH